MKIAVLESLGINKTKWDQCVSPFLKQGHEIVSFERETSEEILIQNAKDADAVIIANMPLSGNVIRNCEKLKFIDVAFTGVDHVDLAAAKERCIAVSNASGYSNEAVAELTISMMLALLRNLKAVEERCREGSTKDGLIGRELKGKTVGIVGTGKIGTRTAQLCRAFGCEILGTRRNQDKEKEDFITYVPLDELLEKSDIVTLHCPLTEETRGLINQEKIGLMKNGAILINAARGPVVEEEALAQALNEGKLGGAGIDVFDVEPPLPKDHCLLQCRNTLVTPHVAFASEESMELRADIVFQNLAAWMEGRQENIIC